MNPRIQGRVAPEKYDLYKKTKKEYIQKTGEIVTDGEFLLLCLESLYRTTIEVEQKCSTFYLTEMQKKC